MPASIHPLPGMRCAFLVAAAVLVSCSRADPPAAERACTMIGCDDGLRIEIEGTPTEPYRLEARAPGQEPQVQDCPAPDSCGPLFLIGFVPEEVTVEVVTASGARSSRTLRPQYETLQPNGPDCPPTCRQSRVTVPWPEEARAASGGAAAPP